MGGVFAFVAVDAVAFADVVDVAVFAANTDAVSALNEDDQLSLCCLSRRKRAVGGGEEDSRTKRTPITQASAGQTYHPRSSQPHPPSPARQQLYPSRNTKRAAILYLSLTTTKLNETSLALYPHRL